VNEPTKRIKTKTSFDFLLLILLGKNLKRHTARGLFAWNKKKNTVQNPAEYPDIYTCSSTNRI